MPLNQVLASCHVGEYLTALFEETDEGPVDSTGDSDFSNNITLTQYVRDGCENPDMV